MDTRDWFSLISILLVWIGVGCVCFGNVILWRSRKRLDARAKELVEKLAGGCAPGTHIWTSRHAEPLINELDHMATMMNTLQCERCHEAIALNMRTSVDARGFALDVQVGPAKWSPPDEA